RGGGRRCTSPTGASRSWSSAAATRWSASSGWPNGCAISSTPIPTSRRRSNASPPGWRASTMTRSSRPSTGRRRELERRPLRGVEGDPGRPADRPQGWPRTPAVASLLDRGLDVDAGVTFLVGENGSGKSTIVEALAMAYGLNPEGGSRYARHRTRPTESDLADSIRLVRSPYAGQAYFVRAETTHGLYTYLEANADPRGFDTRLHSCSHGEGFLDLLARKFDGDGFDRVGEPEAPQALAATP